jgi:hypothetical protein
MIDELNCSAWPGINEVPVLTRCYCCGGDVNGVLGPSTDHQQIKTHVGSSCSRVHAARGWVTHTRSLTVHHVWGATIQASECKRQRERE